MWFFFFHSQSAAIEGTFLASFQRLALLNIWFVRMAEAIFFFFGNYAGRIFWDWKASDRYYFIVDDEQSNLGCGSSDRAKKSAKVEVLLTACYILRGSLRNSSLLMSFICYIVYSDRDERQQRVTSLLGSQLAVQETGKLTQISLSFVGLVRAIFLNTVLLDLKALKKMKRGTWRRSSCNHATSPGIEVRAARKFILIQFWSSKNVKKNRANLGIVPRIQRSNRNAHWTCAPLPPVQQIGLFSRSNIFWRRL